MNLGNIMLVKEARHSGNISSILFIQNFQHGKFIETENKSVVGRDQGNRGLRSVCLVATVFTFGELKLFYK